MPAVPQLWMNLLSEHELSSRTFYCGRILTSSHSKRSMCSCLVCIGLSFGCRLKYSDTNTLKTRFQRVMVGISRAVASSCKTKLQRFVIFRRFITYPQGMPNTGEWIWNHMKNVHAFSKERYVIVGYIPTIEFVNATRYEKALESCGAFRKYSTLMQPSLRGSQ